MGLFKSKVEERLDLMIDMCKNNKSNKIIQGCLVMLQYVKSGKDDKFLSELKQCWDNADSEIPSKPEVEQ